jgi:septum formation protein
MTPRLILASTSPRRRELLGLLGLPFETVASRYDESLIDPATMKPSDYVTRLACGKAEEVAGRTNGDALIIGADTTVVLDGHYLNKPADADDARRMLMALSGRTHEVYTGLCLIHGGARLTDYAVTEVTFDTIDNATLAAYVATGEPLDKAGAYGIQGKALAFIPHIKGDYFNVVGLPLEYIRRMLLPYFSDISPTPPQPTFPDPTLYGRARQNFGLDESGFRD